MALINDAVDYLIVHKVASLRASIIGHAG